eukprot:6022825-Lingulodinium_polyedra.AAC.1
MSASRSSVASSVLPRRAASRVVSRFASGTSVPIPQMAALCRYFLRVALTPSNTGTLILPARKP